MSDGATGSPGYRPRCPTRVARIIERFLGSEHLWDCAKAVRGAGTPQAEQWTEPVETLLWDRQDPTRDRRTVGTGALAGSVEQADAAGSSRKVSASASTSHDHMNSLQLQGSMILAESRSREVTESARNRRSLTAYGTIVLLGVISGAIVLGAVRFSVEFLPSSAPNVLSGLCHWDGGNYRRIVTDGYNYEPKHRSIVAFFPGYPIAARMVECLLNTRDALALAAVSELCLIAAMLAMDGYLSARNNRRISRADEFQRSDDPSIRSCVLLAMALMPTTFFFRMAYSESMFLLAAILALYAMAQSRGALVPSIAVGFATAVRPIGIGLLLPLAWSIRKRSTSKVDAARRFVCLLPLSCWGVLAYMVFQYWKFRQPFAFALTQEHWHLRPPAPVGERLLSLLSWEPIRNVYIPGAPGYWRPTDGVGIPLFSLQFANPIYFLGTVGLIALGAGRRWITVEELLMSIAFLAIPYFTRGYEMCMASQGRFAAVVFPVYIVLGQLLSRVGTSIAVAILAFAAFLMAAYSALFAAGYALI